MGEYLVRWQREQRWSRPRPQQIKNSESKPRKKAQALSMNRSTANIGPARIRVADRRRTEAVEMETGVAGDGGRLPGMTKEYTGWDVYNNEAKKVDTELVNDWRDSLNSLLLFAAIFAAVLTAFIIESRKMLELDPTRVMMDVMIFYTNSLANGTHTIFTPSDFEPDSWAITVNCLFFASLSTSLVAALASVVSLQWVADYDAAITRGGSSPEDRAKRRQFRYAGLVRWKMGELIAALPLLLYCSVVLFFGGLALWMWEVNHIVGFVVVGGAALAVLFYGVSTLLSVMFVSAPFRTPPGRWIYSSIRISLSFIYHLSAMMQIPVIPTWLEKRNLSSAITRRREDREVENRPEMGMEALVWLANELSVSQDSYDRLLLLAGELPKLKREISSFPGFLEAPWALIFDLLGWKNLRNDQDEPITLQDRNGFSVLAQCYRIPEIHEIIIPTSIVPYATDANHDEYWSQYCKVTRIPWLPKPSSNRPNSLFLLLRDIPLPSTGISDEIELTIRLSRWRNSPQMFLKPNEESGPRIAPSTTDTTSINESIVNVGVYPKVDGLPLWFSSDDNALYAIIMRRKISMLGTDGTIPPAFLDALRLRFEAQVLGERMVDKTTCLSAPVQYRDVLHDSSGALQSLHHAFTLLLARNLSMFVGGELAFRVKEILAMMWASRVRRPLDEAVHRVGMENFFEANKLIVMGWIVDCPDVPYIHEIFHHLGIAQANESNIGPLWRAATHQQGDDPRLLNALRAFEQLIDQGVTPEQHYALIDLACQDLTLGPPEAFKGYFTIDHVESIDDLKDPCLRLLGQSRALSGTESFSLSPKDTDGALKDSWARIATYFMSHWMGTNLQSILSLQSSLWLVIPNRDNLCSQALVDPKVFSHLQRMFKYPIACSEHRNSEGHLLLHILNESCECKVDTDLTAYTGIPIRGRTINTELILMILPDNRYIIPPEYLSPFIHTECLARILEIGKAVVSSQFSALSVLSEIPARLLKGSRSSDICSEELAAISIGVLRALSLPRDPRVAQIIPVLVSGIRKVREEMYSRGIRPEWENRIADKEATLASNRLMTHLACMKIVGGQSVRMLFCSRARDSHSPAIGWLAMHAE